MLSVRCFALAHATRASGGASRLPQVATVDVLRFGNIPRGFLSDFGAELGDDVRLRNRVS